MKCIVAEHSGFCHGVKDTVAAIEEMLRNGDKNVYSVGLPVHNPQLTERLISKGLHVVQSEAEIKEGMLVVRAHGLPPIILDKVRSRGVKIIDSTCGFVVRAQKIAQQLFKDGYRVIITGEKNHPEVKSLLGFAENAAFVCEHDDDVADIPDNGKFGVVSQTTFSEQMYRRIIERLLRRHFQEIRIFNTVCKSIAKRIEAAKIVATQVDVMFIIGGKMSANTRRLFEACKQINENSYHIETKEDIENSLISDKSIAGITAGASTPDWLVEDIKTYLSNH